MPREITAGLSEGNLREIPKGKPGNNVKVSQNASWGKLKPGENLKKIKEEKSLEKSMKKFFPRGVPKETQKKMLKECRNEFRNT